MGRLGSSRGLRDQSWGRGCRWGGGSLERLCSVVKAGLWSWCNVLSLLLQAHKSCGDMSEIEAKVRYVKLARSLKTYGVSFFLVKVEQLLLWPHFRLTEILLLHCPSVVTPAASPQPMLLQFFLHLSCCISLCTAFLLLGSCFFLIVKLHVRIVTTRKCGLAGVLVAMADLRYFCLAGSIPGIAHSPSIVTHRRR